MKIFKHKFVLALWGVLTIGGASLYVMNQPPSIEYLKEHPEKFSFEGFKANVQAEQFVDKASKVNMRTGEEE